MPQAKALVLDDDKDVCEIIAMILREEDCEVTALTDVEALRTLSGLEEFDFAFQQRDAHRAIHGLGECSHFAFQHAMSIA